MDESRKDKKRPNKKPSKLEMIILIFLLLLASLKVSFSLNIKIKEVDRKNLAKEVDLPSNDYIGFFTNDLPIIDYISESILIFHDYNGIFIYNFIQEKIVASIDPSEFNGIDTIGDFYTEVEVSKDGSEIYISSRTFGNEKIVSYNVKDKNIIEITENEKKTIFDINYTDMDDIPSSIKLDEYVTVYFTNESGDFRETKFNVIDKKENVITSYLVFQDSVVEKEEMNLLGNNAHKNIVLYVSNRIDSDIMDTETIDSGVFILEENEQIKLTIKSTLKDSNAKFNIFNSEIEGKELSFDMIGQSEKIFLEKGFWNWNCIGSFTSGDFEIILEVIELVEFDKEFSIEDFNFENLENMTVEEIDRACINYIETTGEFNYFYNFRQFMSVEGIDNAVNLYLNKTSDYRVVGAALDFMSQEESQKIAREYIDKYPDGEYVWIYKLYY